MSKRFVGQASLIESNASSAGMVRGEQVGGMMPGVLESLQEAPSALDTNSLYYEEALGSFLAPSFQRNYGVKNETVQNIDGWGQVGTFSVNNDIFWNGPAALSIKIPLKQRWAGTLAGGDFADSCFMRPSFFYSWGAGYAAFKEFRMNMGGAGRYVIDRYANFIGVFMSCFSANQRMALMKISGGGVIAESNNLETSFSSGRPTATYGYVQNYWLDGQPVASAGQDTLIPKFVRVPVEDNWVVAIKTPHTNYQNCRVRRRPVDTKLFSETFNVDFTLANFDEFADTGANVPVLKCAKFYVGPNKPVVGDDAADMCFTTLAQNHRQYSYIYPEIQNFNAARGIYLGHYNATSYTTFNSILNIDTILAQPYNTTVEQNGTPDLMTVHTLPVPEINTLISSMRLTNDMLGAYDVLKTRTDQAVYYPFQHFTTQIYYVQNIQYGNLTLADYILNSPDSVITHPSNERTDQKSNYATIAIPVNPMTAMYVAVAREKDRASQGISVAGHYSPCLFWNFLPLHQLELSYGSEPLIRYDTMTDYISEQMYEHCTPIQIPYKGGFCLKSEASAAQKHSSTEVSYYQRIRTSNNPGDGHLVIDIEPRYFKGSSSTSPGTYAGIMRNSWIYELSLVEMEPLRNEAFFQQTPSFQGEQLNLRFKIEPSTLAFGGSYNPLTDISYIDNYSGQQGCVEHVGLTQFGADATRANIYGPFSANTNTGYNNSEKGGPPGQRKVDVWHMNNDPHLMVVVVYAQNALWQLNPNMSKLVFARG